MEAGYGRAGYSLSSNSECGDLSVLFNLKSNLVFVFACTQSFYNLGPIIGKEDCIQVGIVDFLFDS